MSPLISGLISSVASMIFNAATAGPGKAQAGRRNGEETPQQPSSFVHLSPEAASLLGTAGNGLSVGPGSSAVPQGTVAASLQGASVSREDFRTLLDRFGATAAQKDKLVAGFDSNNDGRIGQDELLEGLSKTRGPQADSEFAQTVLELMDRAGNADGTVARQEFALFTTAFGMAHSGPRQV